MAGLIGEQRFGAEMVPVIRAWSGWCLLLLCCHFIDKVAAAEEIPKPAESRFPRERWIETWAIPAPEANQAAAADERFVYAITNTLVARYERDTGRRVDESSGAARHLNSGFLSSGRLYCAHSNYPQTPEQSEIKVLDLDTMRLTTFHDFGNFGGSLTWAVLREGHWWCNFARYGAENCQTFLVEFDSEWRELRRWTYPAELIRQLGKYSLSGGIWSGEELLVTGHDDRVLFRLRLSETTRVLQYVDAVPIPFTGQGFAQDPRTGGLVGIDRAKKQILFASHEHAAETSRLLQPELRHLRSGPVREWSDFPEQPQGTSLELTFASATNATEAAIFLRQQNVKQDWHVQLNGQKLGELTRDENDMRIGFPVPAGRLREGENRLQIAARSAEASLSDDIRVGEIRLVQRPLKEVLTESALEVRVIDADTGQPVPCRLTITAADGVLPMLGSVSTATMAVRPGIAYLANGQGQIELPAGRYTVYAGRGFEYSLAQQEITLAPGKSGTVSLELRREVPTPGYVACDPHVHTLTHSGHGDCTIEERMLTIAGEGIELPIATDHNKQIDYESIARRLQVRSHFTPVIGNEVTTAQGHFNIFPVTAEKAAPDHRLKTWPEIFAEIIRQADPPIIILNHAQDLHSGVRPFGPTLFNAAVAEHRFEWPARLNAMEVLNSGATQTDPLQLFRNWMELLNRGRSMAPIGSSDSHDVSRHFVGQGRTYLRCADQDPSQISVPDAVQALQQGRVLVSYGLLTELIVEEQYRSGDLAPARESSCRMTIRVLGPHWVQAERVLLFANGQLIREFDLSETPQKRTERGVLWSETCSLPRPQHDVHLVAVAIGPGIDKPYWRTARPYQPVTQNPATHLIGCSGAVWLDVDGDGQRTSAREYAERLVAQHRNKMTPFVTALGNYDAAVAAQAAALQHQAGMSLTDPDVQRIWQAGRAATSQGFNNYVSGWRAGEIARQQSAAPQ